MKIVFYITNHGYGHASRNAAIIECLLTQYKNLSIIVKSDIERCAFIRRNLIHFDRYISYYEDCYEVGLMLKEGTLIPDVELTKKKIQKDILNWNRYIERETAFLKEEKPDLVVSDVICWGIKSAFDCGIKSVLIGNFTWSSMYKSFLGKEMYNPYLEYYRMADLSIWYEIHDKELEEYTVKSINVSLISRKVDEHKVAAILAKHIQPIIFVTVGASAYIKRPIDVSDLPYDFVSTKGIELVGSNVSHLPDETINTQDYIAASQFVIAKGGWSTISEILLQQKRCCLLKRGYNMEDVITEEILGKRNHCLMIAENDLNNIRLLINRMKKLKPEQYDYYDSTEQISSILYKEAGLKGETK